MKAISAFCLLLLASGCSHEEEKSTVRVSRIEDPYISRVSEVLEYIEAASATGSMRVVINGHPWSFHHGTVIEEGTHPLSTVEIDDISELPKVIDWIEKNKKNVILYYPSQTAPASTFWAVVDELENKEARYGTSRNEPVGLLRIEAYKTMSNQSGDDNSE